MDQENDLSGHLVNNYILLLQDPGNIVIDEINFLVGILLHLAIQ